MFRDGQKSVNMDLHHEGDKMSFEDALVSRKHFFSIGRDTKTGKYYLEIPVDNMLVVYGENYEIETMYPGFLVEAAEHHHTEAVRTFTWALEAEKTHSRLYSEAIALLEAGKKEAGDGSWLGEAKDFYVCPVCGYTSEDPEEHERCPVCNLPMEKFEVIQ